MRNGHPKKRPKPFNEKLILYSNECNRQRYRRNFFYRVKNYNNSMSLARYFPYYNLYSSRLEFKREFKEYIYELAMKNFKYKSYAYGWTVSEANEIPALLWIY